MDPTKLKANKDKQLPPVLTLDHKHPYMSISMLSLVSLQFTFNNINIGKMSNFTLNNSLGYTRIIVSHEFVEKV